MSRPTGTLQPQKRYKGAHRAFIIVESVSCNRVRFYHDGYQSPYVQPPARFTKKFVEVNQ